MSKIKVEDVEFGQPFIHNGILYYNPHNCGGGTVEGVEHVTAKRVNLDGHRLNPRGRWTWIPWGTMVELSPIKLGPAIR